MPEIPDVQEISTSKPLDAVVVCGMGPVLLRNSQTVGTDQENIVAANVMNFLNAISAKLLIAHGAAERVILSGYTSQKHPGVIELTPLQNLEKETSEAELLQATYLRAKPKGLSNDKKIRAADETRVILDQEARTTFGNIIQALNILDQNSGGYWQGSFAVLSSEFHCPRIREMLNAFGLNKARVLSAERIFRRFGYEKSRLHPIHDLTQNPHVGSLTTRRTWEDFDNDVFRGQPSGLGNLQGNPAYVTFELAAIKSDVRLQEIADSLRLYYRERIISMPEIFNELPTEFDQSYNYDGFRTKVSWITNSKDQSLTAGFPPNDTQPYRQQAGQIGQETDEFLDSIKYFF